MSYVAFLVCKALRGADDNLLYLSSLFTLLSAPLPPLRPAVSPPILLSLLSAISVAFPARQVYENADDAREAMTHLNGFHLMERYIVGTSLPPFPS